MSDGTSAPKTIRRFMSEARIKCSLWRVGNCRLGLNCPESSPSRTVIRGRALRSRTYGAGAPRATSFWGRIRNVACRLCFQEARRAPRRPDAGILHCSGLGEGGSEGREVPPARLARVPARCRGSNRSHWPLGATFRPPCLPPPQKEALERQVVLKSSSSSHAPWVSRGIQEFPERPIVHWSGSRPPPR